VDGCQTWNTSTNYYHKATVEHILTHRSSISISSLTNHNLFLDDDSSCINIKLIYTRNSELFSKTIYPNTVVYKHTLFTIACLNNLHHLVLLHHTTNKRTQRSVGDTTPDQSATESRIVVDVSSSDLTLLIIFMNCFISRTAMTTSYCTCHMIRRTEPALTYIYYFLVTSTNILKLLDTNMTLTHHPTLTYDKRTSNS
jgi:hypothetical protein